MNDAIFYIPTATPVMRQVRQILLDQGWVAADTPCPAVTHLLLGVPSLEPDGSLKGGGSLELILHSLPPDITVIGGNLDSPRLDGYRKIDLLKNEDFLWENASITADCAIPIARREMGRVWKDCPVLILGWGRIGQQLGWMLKGLQADITIAARKERDRAMAKSFGFRAVDYREIQAGYPVIFNTVPSIVMPDIQWDCVRIDLASAPGIGGSGVIWARGLPGKDAVESSAALIAKTILDLIKNREVSA